MRGRRSPRRCSEQLLELDYAPAFQMGHPKVFELAARLTAIAPQGLDHVFFTNSGSESVETALKIALAYHRVKGDGEPHPPDRPRARLSRRQFRRHRRSAAWSPTASISARCSPASTTSATRTTFPATPLRAACRSTARSSPTTSSGWSRCTTRRPSPRSSSSRSPARPACCIPPKGYLQRLRQICDKHGILLIFDEVITGFGRLGAPFGADYFGVTPDIMTTAKGLTNGVVPMGAVFVKKDIYEAFMNGPEHLIEFFHGYTYSGNPAVDRGEPRHARHLPARGAADARAPRWRSTGRTRCSA